MTREELKEFFLSRISKDKDYWQPRIDSFFQETPDITRESFHNFFWKYIEENRKRPGTIWGQMMSIAYGETLRSEDIADVAQEVDIAFDELELMELQSEMAVFVDQFRMRAIEAFNKNDRYTCAIYYTLYAIAMNKDLKDDLYIKSFLMERIFTPSTKVTLDISLNDSQKKEVVDSIFKRSYKAGFGYYLQTLDLSLVECDNLPFETTNKHGMFFFDFIGICKRENIWPDIRTI